MRWPKKSALKATAATAMPQKAIRGTPSTTSSTSPTPQSTPADSSMTVSVTSIGVTTPRSGLFPKCCVR
jgi:hypothetical protein